MTGLQATGELFCTVRCPWREPVIGENRPGRRSLEIVAFRQVLVARAVRGPVLPGLFLLGHGSVWREAPRNLLLTLIPDGLNATGFLKEI
jgi:hypothetical protein